MPTGPKVWKIARNVTLVLAGLAAVFFFLFVPWFFAKIITTGRFHFPDPNNGKTPKSFGMDFRWVEFLSTDGIPLKGWHIPAVGGARGTIIYCHGHNRTRVEMLPKAAFAHELGYSGLLFDFRNHGQSGGKISTVGYAERQDVLGAVRYALVEAKAARPIVLWGVSMGAAAALMAAGSADVDAVISDSSFLSFADMISHHWKLLLPLPSFPFANEVVYWSAWRGKFRPSDFDLRKATRRIGNRPILFLALEGDRRMPPSIARALHAEAQSPRKRLVVLPGQRHGEGFKLAPEQYRAAVSEFLASLREEAAAKGGAQCPR